MAIMRSLFRVFLSLLLLVLFSTETIDAQRNEEEKPASSVQYNSNEDIYYICPLGNEVVDLEHNSTTNSWVVADKPSNTTMKAKPCWCISYGSIQPHYCPPEYDTCRISGDMQVSCLILKGDDPSRRKTDWIVPLLGPIILLIYGTIILMLLYSQKGLAARQYVYRKFMIAFHILTGGCFNSGGDSSSRTCDQMNQLLLRKNLERAIHDFPNWCRLLLYEGVMRERELLERSGQPDPYLRPNRLELKTTLFHYDAESVTLIDENKQCHLQVQQQPEIVTKANNNEKNKIENKDSRIRKEHEEEKEEEDKENLHSDDIETAIPKGNDDDDDKEKRIVEADTPSIIFSDDDSKMINCVICMGSIDNGDRIGNLECKHIFHVDCLKKWLKKKNECPMCLAKNIAMPKA